MDWWTAALWGMLGGGLVEILDFYTEIRTRGSFPWSKPYSKKRDQRRPPAVIYAVGSLLRLSMALGVAAAAGASDIADKPWIAVATGIAAPLILQRLAAQVPFAIGPPATASRVESKPDTLGEGGS